MSSVTTINDLFTEHEQKQMKEMMSKLTELRGLEVTKVIVDEVGMTSEAEAQSLFQGEMAKGIGEQFALDKRAFSLAGPCILTVIKNLQFTKRSHIGGESLVPMGCYVGKRHSLIYIMRPEFASDYQHVEITASEAKTFFGSDFHNYMRQSSAGKKMDQMVASAKLAVTAAKEAKVSEAKSKVYASMGWGAW